MLFPDEYLDSTYVINFDDLYAQGYRGLLFDIDNTLVPHGAPADERACALFAHLKELGFKCCFLSNNQYERVSSFNDAIGAQFIENAHKPSTKNYIRAMELLGTDRSNTVFIGDQLFTDIWCETHRNPEYSGETTQSERRDSDRTETIS